MKTSVIDIKGNKVKDINLKDYVFSIEPNKEVIGQYLRVYLANQRQGTAHTKTRAEVSGGGRKPWRQKGTDRARHGSIRSPIWVGGGVAHGPRAKSWRLALPKKLKKLAMRSALSQAFIDNKAVIIDKIEVKSGKTKDVQKTLTPVLGERDNLIVWIVKDDGLIKGSENLSAIHVKSAENLNPYDVLKYDKVIFFEDAAKYLEEKYQNETK